LFGEGGVVGEGGGGDGEEDREEDLHGGG
jgi:hypothetical protein